MFILKMISYKGVDRVGQWVQLHPSILRKISLHPSIEIPQGLLSILHLSIEIHNDAPVFRFQSHLSDFNCFTCFEDDSEAKIET